MVGNDAMTSALLPQKVYIRYTIGFHSYQLHNIIQFLFFSKKTPPEQPSMPRNGTSKSAPPYIP
jgi:hypothetical protein